MANSKATSKQSKSSAPTSPRRTQPLPRTTSGRQRKPTEKENYRLSESQHIVRRQARKEDKLEKRKKKALKSAYQGNPKDFEREPSELLSDPDRAEDTMFSDHSVQTKLSNARVLTFSTTKIPVAPHTSGSERKSTTRRDTTPTSNVDDSSTTSDDTSDESSDNSRSEAGADVADEEDEDIIEEPSTTAQGTKRPLDTAPEDAMVRPKIKKNVDGSRQRVKASDFDDISKEILTTATSIFRCLVVTRAPFPDTIAVETKLAKEAWREAGQIKGTNVKLMLEYEYASRYGPSSRDAISCCHWPDVRRLADVYDAQLASSFSR
ncbi:hypothetical protein DEU56DRAFT_761304 [Suillus clintonianus]|uniref:uncharacterized protein n=1 Tax=Suillus clintonianus TaxID=1904413 RepID=UPI001B86B07A|nr:uncharacterized protein DEU56DRAFT_761304 [Suillus clintonianus]KAG2117747.1 hypothetical protein DEU56DRAFT_761304 [Suillus clintonianus]